MDACTLPADVRGEFSLGALMDVLAAYPERALVIHYAGRVIQPGYHVTEVKAGSFVTLDCGGHPDAWNETILQVEDLPASAETPAPMTAGRLLAILDKVGRRVTLDHAARLTFEVGPADEPMQVFDVAALQIEADQILMQLGARPAICKPRHRVQQADACAAPPACRPKSGCC